MTDTEQIHAEDVLEIRRRFGHGEVVRLADSWLALSAELARKTEALEDATALAQITADKALRAKLTATGEGFTYQAGLADAALSFLAALAAELARKTEALDIYEDALNWYADQSGTTRGRSRAIDAFKRVAALAVGTTEAECDGSRGCKATVHILGCFAGPPEDLPPAGTEEESDTTGENFAARVQKAHRLIAAGDEAGLIAYLIGRPREDVIAIASFPAEDTTALTEPEQGGAGPRVASSPSPGSVSAVRSPASEEKPA